MRIHTLWIIVIGLLLSISMHARSMDTLNDPVASLPDKELRAFAKAYHLIQEKYVNKVSQETLFEGAIKGMVQALDTHSKYLNEDQFKQLTDATRGDFEGVGIDVMKQDALFSITKVIPESPAASAHLTPGDIILTIDDTPIDGFTHAQVAQSIKGPPGTHVSLTVLSLNESTTRKVRLLRQKITPPSVTWSLINDGYAHIMISHFQSHTREELRSVIASIHQHNIRGIVLDLRNNPGGLFDAAIETADAFMNTGLIAYTKRRGEKMREDYHASNTTDTVAYPMTVLINQHSASAAEIVAGALKDNRRATLIGHTSYGKGSVQSILPLSDKNALKLTTELYFTPSGNEISSQGITPDIKVKYSKEAVQDESQDASLETAINHFQMNSDFAKK